MHWVQVPCFGCLPLGSGQLSAGLCSPGICLCFASQGKIPWREWKAQEVLYELTACCRLKRFMVTEESGTCHLGSCSAAPSVGVPCSGHPRPHAARDPQPSSRQAGREVKLGDASPSVHTSLSPRPPAPSVCAGHRAKCQTTKRERPGSLGSAAGVTVAAASSHPTHPRTDGRTDRQPHHPPSLLATGRLLPALVSCSRVRFSSASPSLCPLEHFDTGEADAWLLAAGRCSAR